MPGENILQTLQKIATVVHRIDTIAEDQRELRASMATRLEKLEEQMTDVRERLARLETARESDRAQMQANMAQFKLEVERAALRLKQLPPEQS